MSEQALNRTIDTLMDRIEKLRAENLSLRAQIAKNEAESDRIIEEHISSKQNPCQDGPESTGDTGGMVGCQPDNKNAAEEPTAPLGRNLHCGKWHLPMGLEVFLELERLFERRAQSRTLTTSDTEKHYGHLFDKDLMELQTKLVSTGLWEMIPNNLGQADDYWARRVR